MVGKTYAVEAAPPREDCFSSCLQRDFVDASCESAVFSMSRKDCCTECGGVLYDTGIPSNARNGERSTFDIFHYSYTTSMKSQHNIWGMSDITDML